MKPIATLLFALVTISGSALAQAHSYAEREEVRSFMREMADRHGFVPQELRQLFTRAQRLDPVLTAIKPSSDPRAQNWPEYRALFLSPERVDAGVEFWRSHEETLARAERRFGVGAEYIVAIIGVETFYGRRTGRWRVIDTLTTLAFDYPPRRRFFLGELENYLLLTRSTGIDVFSVKGSFAGAIGIPQFMPGSYRRYAIDFDGDGIADLRDNAADSIGSVANFLKEHGWRPGGTVLLDAAVPGSGHEPFASGEVKPRHTIDELARAGVIPRDEQASRELTSDTPAVLVALPVPGQAPEYRLGFQNFYVLTRYNRSSMYAAAVHDLAQAVRAARPAQNNASARP